MATEGEDKSCVVQEFFRDQQPSIGFSAMIKTNFNALLNTFVFHVLEHCVEKCVMEKFGAALF